MASPAAEENGYRRARPGIPTGVVVAAVIIALVAVSLLLAILYRETKGPGEILREFARKLDEGDCRASFDLLHPSITSATAGARPGLTATDWCDQLAAPTDGQLDADFELERAVLTGDRATVHISGSAERMWLLARYGERSWRVLGPASTGPFRPPP
jgi:hypothetical protein